MILYLNSFLHVTRIIDYKYCLDKRFEDLQSIKSLSDQSDKHCEMINDLMHQRLYPFLNLQFDWVDWGK
jgi:hypothetical protein